MRQRYRTVNSSESDSGHSMSEAHQKGADRIVESLCIGSSILIALHDVEDVLQARLVESEL